MNHCRDSKQKKSGKRRHLAGAWHCGKFKEGCMSTQ